MNHILPWWNVVSKVTVYSTWLYVLSIRETLVVLVQPELLVTLALRDLLERKERKENLETEEKM